MEKILKRALACALGSLLAFNGVSLPFSASDLFTRGITATKAETDVPFDSGYLDDESLMYEQYKLLPIYSLLNMTKEQGQQKFKLRDLFLASFLFNDGSLITIPSLEISYNIIDDKDKNTEDNIINLKYGISILDSVYTSYARTPAQMAIHRT